jgi:putative transposase
MARLPQIHIPNGLYSVVSKCTNDEFLFDTSEKFEMYIRHLIKCKCYFGFKMYDIVCMSNHVHELYQVPEEVTISQILQRVKGHFSYSFNKKYGRSSHFWRNRAFYRIVEDESYAFNTMHYFHGNPVKAGLVEDPKDWPYSGYRFHILNERGGLLGKLLDRLPDSMPIETDRNKLRAIEKIFRTRNIRFIGSQKYRRSMRKRYGK